MSENVAIYILRIPLAVQVAWIPHVPERVMPVRTMALTNKAPSEPFRKHILGTVDRADGTATVDATTWGGWIRHTGCRAGGCSRHPSTNTHRDRLRVRPLSRLARLAC